MNLQLQSATQVIMTAHRKLFEAMITHSILLSHTQLCLNLQIIIKLESANNHRNEKGLLIVLKLPFLVDCALLPLKSTNCNRPYSAELLL